MSLPVQVALRERGVRHRELAAGREPLEQLHGLAGGREAGFGPARRTPAAARAIAARHPTRAHRPARAAAPPPPPGRPWRPRSGPWRRTRRRGARAAAGRCRSAALARTARRPRGARRRAAARAPRAGAKSQHRVRVARRVGMVGEPREVGCVGAVAPAPASAARWSSSAARGRQRLLDREPRELVPEGDARLGRRRPSRPRGTRRGRRTPGRRSPRAAQVDARRHDRDRLEQRSRVAAQPRGAGEDRVAHRRREYPSPPPASTSVTKNGLPPVRR